MVRKNVEAAVQAALIVWIHYTFPVIKVIPIANETMRKQDIDNGHPDLLLVCRKSGITYYFHLELKTLKRRTAKNGGLRQSQIDWNKDFDKNFKSANATRDVAHGFKDARELITAWYGGLQACKQKRRTTLANMLHYKGYFCQCEKSI